MSSLTDKFFKMYSLADLCSLCLVDSKTIISILSKDNDGIVVKNKLEYALSEVMNYKPEILKNICTDCLKGLNYVYKFKQKCLHNVISLNDYIEKMTENKDYNCLETNAGEVQKQVTTPNHFLATENKPVQNYEAMDTNSLCESIQQNIVKNEPDDFHDETEMQYNSVLEECAENVLNLNNRPVSNAECNLVPTNSVYIQQPNPLCENLIPENHQEPEMVVKQEVEYINDELDIKYDPLLSEEENCIDTFSDEATNNSEESAAGQALLSVKSKEKYESAYQQFESWCKTKRVKMVKEEILLVYFEEKSKVLKSSSLWCLYSMLRTTLSVKKNVDIKKFVRLIAFIKNKSIGHQSKKANVLTRSDIERFLKEAEDSTYLMMKVVLIVGISGACGRDELAYLRIDNIKDLGTSIVIEIPHSTKTNERREFTITSGTMAGLDLVAIFRKYSRLRPSPTSTSRPSPLENTRFFLGYRNGKCTKQSVGINSIGSIPRRIAEYLKLPDPSSYTGHSFRRSSATVLADTGRDIVVVKRLGGWK